MRSLDHHAFLVDTAGSFSTQAVLDLFDDEPELVLMNEGTLSIEHARSLIDLSALKSSEDRPQVFIIRFDTAGRDAQNALLQVLEEPTSSTYFFIHTPSAHTLLPTLLSRLSKISFDTGATDADDGTTINPAAFLRMSPEERLALVEPLSEEKNRAATARLVRGVAEEFMNARGGKIEHGAWVVHARDIERLLSYSTDPSSSPKMLLEHLSLTLPVL